MAKNLRNKHANGEKQMMATNYRIQAEMDLLGIDSAYPWRCLAGKRQESVGEAWGYKQTVKSKQ